MPMYLTIGQGRTLTLIGTNCREGCHMRQDVRDKTQHRLKIRPRGVMDAHFGGTLTLLLMDGREKTDT